MSNSLLQTVSYQVLVLMELYVSGIFPNPNVSLPNLTSIKSSFHVFVPPGVIWSLWLYLMEQNWILFKYLFCIRFICRVPAGSRRPLFQASLEAVLNWSLFLPMVCMWHI